MYIYTHHINEYMTFQACVERVKELTEEFDLVKDPHVKAELMHERSVLNRKVTHLACTHTCIAQLHVTV